MESKNYNINLNNLKRFPEFVHRCMSNLEGYSLAAFSYGMITACIFNLRSKEQFLKELEVAFQRAPSMKVRAMMQDILRFMFEKPFEDMALNLEHGPFLPVVRWRLEVNG